MRFAKIKAMSDQICYSFGRGQCYTRQMSANLHARPPFLEIADAFADAVTPAPFPEATLRFRNQKWAQDFGLGGLSDAQWTTQFSTFVPLPDNLPQPLAMRYHGHQFGSYNPELGDGRGFLFAQVQSASGKWYDLGTKGSGQTPWSRQGDGRLTLKGGVREVLAASYLEALGVKTSKLFSLIETGEALTRGDEPSPARSSVMVRLSETHLRIGTFQRAMALGDMQALARLVEHTVTHYHPAAKDPDMARQCAALLELIARDVGKMVGQWMGVGFVHGVMNTDNFNITGETFDFGPYRFLPISDPNFTAAYFDQQGLYRFGRQPGQGLWALQQLGAALSPLADTQDMHNALKAYEPAYHDGFISQTFRMLGIQRTDIAADLDFLSLFYAWMTESKAPWPQVFFDWFGGPASSARAKESPVANYYEADLFAPVHTALMARNPIRANCLETDYFQTARPVSLLIDEIEAVWTPIAETDDWSAFEQKLKEIKTLSTALSGASP